LEVEARIRRHNMPGQATVTIGDKQWNVSVATASWELVKGLGGLPSLPAGSGMLFDLGVPQTIQVTTVPMLFPLDIAFLSETLVVTEVYRDIQPGYLVTSQMPARYFLEINSGELEGIDAGDRVTVEVLTPAQTAIPDWASALLGFMGFAMLGILTIGIVKDPGEELSANYDFPRRLHGELKKEFERTEALLAPGRFPKRDEALKRLGRVTVVQIHDDGDLTVRSQGRLFVVTTDGEVFAHYTPEEALKRIEHGNTA
jgi:uncharacterized membrane protein (UPF0127 family)